MKTAFACLLVALTTAAAPVGLLTPPVSGCIGWWTLNENTGTAAHDYSGCGQNGVLTNFTATSGMNPAWTSGEIGSSLQFAFAQTNYVSIPYSTTLKPAGGAVASYTVCYWMYLTNILSASETIAWCSDLLNPQGYKSGIYVGLTGTGNLEVTIGQNTSVGPTSRNTFASTAAMNTNTWIFVSDVISNANAGTLSMLVYSNGVSLPGSYSGSGGTSLVFNTGCGEGIGAHLLVNGGLIEDGWNGRIDDVRVYNRVLSPAEILKIMNDPQH